MVVVGRTGKFIHACCALMRSANGDLRWSAPSGKLATRCCTASLWIFLLVARSAAAASEAAMASATLSLPCAKACLTVPNSTNFWAANAIQDLISLSSFSSTAKSCGLCNSEQLGAIHKLLPNLAFTGAKVSITLLKLARHTLRPSIKPTDNTLLVGNCSANTANCSGARTQSMCTPCTGKPFNRLRCSATEAK